MHYRSGENILISQLTGKRSLVGAESNPALIPLQQFSEIVEQGLPGLWAEEYVVADRVEGVPASLDLALQCEGQAPVPRPRREQTFSEARILLREQRDLRQLYS